MYHERVCTPGRELGSELVMDVQKRKQIENINKIFSKNKTVFKTGPSSSTMNNSHRVKNM